MALLYLIKKPQVFGHIVRWIVLFLEYDFLMVYKLGKSHSIVDVLSHLLAFDEPSGMSDQIIDATLFLLQLAWLQKI